MTSGRRDDLIQLTYLLIMILNGGQLVGIFYEEVKNNIKCFQKIKNKKINSTLKELCSGRSRYLKPFMVEVFSLRFKDKPNYDKLRNILSEIIRVEEE